MAESEATLWHTLRHPNITTLFGVSADEHGHPMLIMERAETSLISRLHCWKGEEPVSREIKMRWILQIAQAFKYLHMQKNPVIHADLNPRNVLIGFDGVAKITDFGLSRCLIASHTFSRQVHGTIRYSPPESFGRKYQATTAYDVYSFAMTIYEILSQVQPFDEAQFPEMISSWVRDGERPESQPNHIPEDSWEWSLIQACWDQDPSKRPSFEEIVKTISTHLDLPNLRPQSVSLSESISALSVSPSVPARPSAFSKDKTETTLVETSTPAAGGKDNKPSFSDGKLDTTLVESPAQAASADVPFKKQPKAQPAASKFEKFLYRLSPKLAAHQGDTSGQKTLGDKYYFGQGVKQDFTKAVEWYTLAANQGYARAQHSLGNMYEHGEGVDQNISKAVEWYTRAANQGEADSQCNLGYIYYSGKGGVQDYSKAMEWFTRASVQGHARANHNLGYMYENGHGVVQNYREAIAYHTLAAQKGYTKAQVHLGDMYEDGTGVRQASSLAVQWYTYAAYAGDAVGQCNLGYMYRNGRGVVQDDSIAVEWYTLAANQGFARAQHNLGLMYEYGEGVEQNYRKAVELHTLAANQGFTIAQAHLGVMYENGLGVTKSAEIAKMWKDKAAQNQI